MLTDFYIAFGTVCFTLLGLWLIVVQTRHAEWRGVAAYRRRAYGVALHFSLPGLMSLLSLVNPASMTLWRVSFAGGAAGRAAGRPRAPRARRRPRRRVAGRCGVAPYARTARRERVSP